MQDNNVRSGVSFASLLALLFIGLKLGHVIDWSWWLVLSPLWLGFAVFLICALFGVIIIGLVALIFRGH